MPVGVIVHMVLLPIVGNKTVVRFVGCPSKVKSLDTTSVRNYFTFNGNVLIILFSLENLEKYTFYSGWFN